MPLWLRVFPWQASSRSVLCANSTEYNGKKKNNNNKKTKQQQQTWKSQQSYLPRWCWVVVGLNLMVQLGKFLPFERLSEDLENFSPKQKKEKKRKGIKHKLPWIHSYAQSWLFRDYSILLCKIGKFCIANSWVSPPTILRTQTRIGQFCINYSGFCRFHYRHSCRQNSNNNSEKPFST